jgi:hypothetical protein
MPATPRFFGLVCIFVVQCAASYVRGRVTDCRDSSPLEGVEVQLTSRTSGVSWTALQTGGDGAYTFQVDKAHDVLPVTLTVAKQGYRATQKVYTSVPPGAEDVCMQPTMR